MQQAELEQAKASHGDIPLSDTKDMVRELEELRVENANMYMIRGENEQLRAQVQALTQQLRDGGAEPSAASSAASNTGASLSDFSCKLWDENQALKKELAALQCQQARPLQDPSDARGDNGLYPIDETVDTDDDLDDDAVAELIARNARGLREIREDLHRVAKMDARPTTSSPASLR